MRILHSKKLVFISKPRCGSTSVRNFLTQQSQKNDLICNVPDHAEGLHPHMSSPAIKSYMKKHQMNVKQYSFFTVTRNPIEMLWSYYKYFQPDENCLYNFSTKHNPSNLMQFEEWLKKGHVGLGKYWRDFVPSFVTGKNFSSLSLEAHICDSNNNSDVDKVFYLEELESIKPWLSEFFDVEVNIPAVNSSDSRKAPKISNEILEILRPQFPLEFKHYSI